MALIRQMSANMIDFSDVIIPVYETSKATATLTCSRAGIVIAGNAISGRS